MAAGPCWSRTRELQEVHTSESNFNQDAILLVDINGRLVFNRNDASDHGWESFVRWIGKQYHVSFLLALSSRFGDADMINYFAEDGHRIPVRENIPSLGAGNAHRTESIGVRYFVPFSSMHFYQHEDSIWADQYHTALTDYANGFNSPQCEVLPAFLSYDCECDAWEEIRPAELPIDILSPAQFGDHWDEPLASSDVNLAERCFKSIEHLAGCSTSSTSGSGDATILSRWGRENPIAASLSKRRVVH